MFLAFRLSNTIFKFNLIGTAHWISVTNSIVYVFDFCIWDCVYMCVCHVFAYGSTSFRYVSSAPISNLHWVNQMHNKKYAKILILTLSFGNEYETELVQWKL